MLHQPPSSQLQHKKHILLLLSQHQCLQVGHQGIVSKKIYNSSKQCGKNVLYNLNKKRIEFDNDHKVSFLYLRCDVMRYLTRKI